MSTNNMGLDVGQASELKTAFRREDGSNGSQWTPEKVKALCETRGLLGSLLDVLEGRAKIVIKTVDTATEIIIQKTTNLLCVIKETLISATPEKEVKKSFIGSRYYYRNPNLDSCFPKVSRAGIESKIAAYQLENELTFKEVVQAILGVDEASLGELAQGLIDGGHTITLPQIETLIERTDANEDTGLRTDGYGNFFFVEDKEGGVSVVGVYRRDGGQWGVGVIRLSHGHRWNVVDRFFSRN